MTTSSPGAGLGDIALLEPAIAELLRTIPETWAEFNPDALTAIQANALFLLTAAGLVERRGWVRATIANHPTCFELRLQATGEDGFVKAIEKAAAVQFASWADAWQTCRAAGNPFPIHAEEILPQEWRLTAQGIIARGDLADDAHSATVFDFVLKRGFFGPGFWLRKPLSGRELADDEKRTIARLLAADADLARLPRPAVSGEGRLVEVRKLDQPTAAKVVNLGNWPEGAASFAEAFGKMLGPMLEGLAAKTNAGAGQAATAEPIGESSPDSPTGFLGGAALADALGVHPTQRDAFFQRLMRQRMNLGDDCWHEVRDPRPHSPRFLYRVDSPKLRDLAAGYKHPKPN